ncbi:MAG TPA: TPM domain-containing protein [Anaeromyxobacter sp.]|nr:TPM domain-containing protein [Anaeromyxobacter sp.]
MRVDRFFGEAVRQRVAEAVARAEALSRGQIVPVVVEKSDPYPEARFRGGLLLAALATALVLALRLPLGLGELVMVEVLAGMAGALLSRWDPVERQLVGHRAMEEAVRARAVRAFHEEGLHRTAEATGVLLFASLFERRAVVLGDRGIHEKIGDAEWDRAVAALLSGVRQGDPGQGFVDAVALCGARLAEHFPRDPATRPPANELEDAIRVER